MFFLKNKKAETLVELTIAILILAVVLIWAMKVLWNSQINANWTEKRIQAVSFAREGIEIMKYVRKLNYMKYSNNKRVCWNFLADNWNSNIYPHWLANWIIDWSDLKCQESLLEIWSANFSFSNWNYYVPVQNISDETSWRFFLSTFWQDLTTAWSKQNNWALFVDLEKFRLCEDLNSWLILSCQSVWLVNKKELGFFRSIKIEYVDIFWQNYDIVANWIKWANHMKITSTVIWTTWWWIQSVDLVTILSDSEDRTERAS